MQLGGISCARRVDERSGNTLTLHAWTRASSRIPTVYFREVVRKAATLLEKKRSFDQGASHASKSLPLLLK